MKFWSDKTFSVYIVLLMTICVSFVTFGYNPELLGKPHYRIVKDDFIFINEGERFTNTTYRVDHWTYWRYERLSSNDTLEEARDDVEFMMIKQPESVVVK